MQALLEPLESRTLLSSVPIGALAVVNPTTISGWAFNADAGANPVNVAITIDGTTSTVTANSEQSNLTTKLGSADHGFSFSVPALATGTHKVTINIVDPTTHVTKLLKATTLTIAPPTGAVSVFNSTTVSGWAYSAADGGTPLDVILTVNGSQYTMTADQKVTSLLTKFGSTDHGFSFTLPALKAGKNTVTVAAVDPSTGKSTVFKSGTINVGATVGGVNVFNTTTISGWAYSPLEGAAPINVIITVNGAPTTVIANGNRPDLVARYGTAYHGFTFTLPALPPGTSTITVDMKDPFTGQVTRLKSGTVYNAPPTATVNVNTATELAGWVSDASTSGSVQIQIMLNGVAMSAPFTANNPRKMKGATPIGFDVTGSFAGKVVEIYAIDQPSGQSKLVWTNNHAPKGTILTATAGSVTGWAVDPDSPSTAVTVRVDVDGVTQSTAAANASIPALQKNSAVSNAAYDVNLTGLAPGKHTVKVYALDDQASAQSPVLLGTRTVYIVPPIGHVNTINSSVVSGWALQTDLGANPTTVNVYVDDSLYTTVTANLPDSQLVAKYHSANHGFSVDLSALTPGTHSVTVTAIDSHASNQDEVVIYDGYVNYSAPVGAVEHITGTTITGWAYCPNDSTSPNNVSVFVDGVLASTTIANLADANAPAANHGFSFALPTLGWGAHKITVYASPATGVGSVLIGSQTVVNNRPTGMLESATATTITGWAADPDILGQSVQVEVYVNGVLTVTQTASVARSDLLTLAPLNTLPSFSNYGFSVTLPTLSTGANQIDVYAIDLNNGQMSSLGSVVLTV